LYTLQINDDDDLPVVNFTDGTGYTDAGDTESTIAENGSSITINVQLSRATERSVTIPFTFTDYGTINNGAQGAAATGDYPIDWYYSSSTNPTGGTADWSTGASFDAAGSVTITGDGTTRIIPVNRIITCRSGTLCPIVDRTVICKCKWDRNRPLCCSA
jgi:hypothetical protein